MVKNPPSNAGDADSILDQGTEIPHATGQLSPHTTTTEPACSRACTLQLEKACMPRQRPSGSKIKNKQNLKKYQVMLLSHLTLWIEMSVTRVKE